MPDDKHLKQAVLDALNWEPSINAAHIGVTAEDGVVTLMGHVGSYGEKHAAEMATLRVKDVKAVAEEIEVKLPMDVLHDDQDIAVAALNRLAWNVSIPRDAVKVTVDQGWITLSGRVDWHYQQEAAHDAVRLLWGVTGVSDMITIKPRANAGNIQASIETALHRLWFPAEHIGVTAADGNVTLTGTVAFWDQRALAATTAWAAPGVTMVTNDIRIE